MLVCIYMNTAYLRLLFGHIQRTIILSPQVMSPSDSIVAPTYVRTYPFHSDIDNL